MTATPFLKWAGGKRKFVPKIMEATAGHQVRRYIEPFLGGGAVFFALEAAGRLDCPVILADRNEALVEAWQMVRDAPQAVIRLASQWPYDETTYYHVRDAFVPEGPVERAAQLLWLNKTCFNGLYRLNKAGRFNVAFGAYKNPKTVDAENILACSRVLQDARILTGDFEAIVEEHGGAGAFVYLDPPYVPRSKTSDFTTYDGTQFVEADQRRVAALAGRLADRGDVLVVAHNSDTELTRELWQPGPRTTVETVEARRNISRDGAGRGAVPELFVVTRPAPQWTVCNPA